VGLGQQPLEEVTEEDLQALLREQVPEGKEIDYKETVHADHGAVREFLADLTSFANTAGGHLLVGMKATNGVPTELIGVSGMPADALISRLESAARDAIEPRLPGVLMHSVRLHSGTEAIVIRIPRSYALPHVVKHQGHWRFYGRNSNGKYQLDVAEVGALFARSQGLAERVRDFRVERLAAIVGGQAAPLLEDGPKLVLHVIPLNALDGRLDVGIPLFVQEETLPRPIGGHASQGVFTFDGWLTTAEGQTAGRVSSYALLFRNGIIEAASSGVLRSHANPAWIPSTVYEHETIGALASYLELERRLDGSPPAAVLLSLLGVADRTLVVGRQLQVSAIMDHQAHTFDRDALLVPELLIERFEEAADQVLRPGFDRVWNACGWDRSYNYTPEGVWTGQQD